MDKNTHKLLKILEQSSDSENVENVFRKLHYFFSKILWKSQLEIVENV